MEAGVIVRNPSNRARVLLMPAIGALVEDKLVGDLSMNADQYDRMIAIDTTIADEWYLWPEANYWLRKRRVRRRLLLCPSRLTC